MATANLVDEPKDIITGMDSVVFKSVLEEVDGGRTLDVTGFTPTVIKAGHIVIHETATDEYKPMPVLSDGSGYDALPDGHTYAGAVRASKPTARPFASIVYAGTINPNASPYPVTDIQAAIVAALPKITFKAD